MLRLAVRTLILAMGATVLSPVALAQDEEDSEEQEEETDGVAQDDNRRGPPPNMRGGPSGGPSGGPPMPFPRPGGDDDGGNQRPGPPGGDNNNRGGPPGAQGGQGGDDGARRTGTSGPNDNRTKPPVIQESTVNSVMMDFVNTNLQDLVKYMAEVTGRNFIISDDLKGEITIISHRPVSVAESYEAFLSALEVEGYTTVSTGKTTKIVKSSDAANAPVRVYQGDAIPWTDNFVTQIIQLENISVNDVSSVVKNLAGQNANIIAYNPTNTLIITDAANNIRRVYKVVSQLDVASPKSDIAIIPVEYATATEIKTIIEELYGTEETEDASSSSSSRTTRRTTRRRRRTTSEDTSEASESKVGSEGKFIEKIIADERTNSLIVQANGEAMEAIVDIIARLDVDIDPTKNAKIHVVYLEHANAEEVADVLSSLADGSSSGASSSRRTTGSSRTSSRSGGGSRSSSRGGVPGRQVRTVPTSGATSVVAAFEDGMSITYDESTNSLVVVATNDQFRILEGVIEKLDIRRKQVFVEAVILELASDDTVDVGLATHMGTADTDTGGINILGAQLNGSSLGLSTDALTGLAIGMYGPDLTVSVDGVEVAIPAFGVALNALQSNTAVNILSTPNILTMDNEEAKIIVGRNIPFPVSTGRDNNNNPIVSYQREDVAITLQVTPQINESNYVTMELFQEVQEVEEGTTDDEGGPTTSKRSAETVVVVEDNQTVVIGGLIGQTDTEAEFKIPILGDMPLIGNLFRGTTTNSRKTNLLIFLTPHIIEEPEDLEEVYRIKMAQRQEYLRRFYGKSREEQEQEIKALLQYSMNHVDEPSVYRTKADRASNYTVIGSEGTETVDGTQPDYSITVDVPDEPEETEAVDETDDTDDGDREVYIISPDDDGDDEPTEEEEQ